jgi:hypothetical protein
MFHVFLSFHSFIFCSFYYYWVVRVHISTSFLLVNCLLISQMLIFMKLNLCFENFYIFHNLFSSYEIFMHVNVTSNFNSVFYRFILYKFIPFISLSIFLGLSLFPLVLPLKSELHLLLISHRPMKRSFDVLIHLSLLLIWYSPPSNL